MKCFFNFFKELFSFKSSNEDYEQNVIIEESTDISNQDIPPIEDILIDETEEVVLSETQRTTDIPKNDEILKSPSTEVVVEKKNFDFFKSLADIILEFDNHYQRIGNRDTKNMIELFQYRLIQVMENNGAKAIDGEKSFNSMRHIPIPIAIVDEGVKIRSFVRKGLEMDNQIVLKAQVIL